MKYYPKYSTLDIVVYNWKIDKNGEIIPKDYYLIEYICSGPNGDDNIYYGLIDPESNYHLTLTEKDIDKNCKVIPKA